jgi:hypothetical protein
MRHNASEFVSFVSKHFRVVQAMCRERVRFTRDDEIVALLQRFGFDDRGALRLIVRMRELGVLQDRVGHWSPPTFLIEFLDQLAEQHSLASPKVIRGWVESLRDLVDRLMRCVQNEGAALLTMEATILDLIDEIADVLHNVVQTVEGNCDRIAQEVNEYRAIEDRQQMRDRLQRLVRLQDDYLTPVIRILDVNEELHATTDEISQCCIRLELRLAGLSAEVVDGAEHLQREVVWLRQITIGRAEEARRDLAPQVEAAVRESKIASGVHKALEQVRQQNWKWLNLASKVAINDDKDSMLFSNVGVEGFLKVATESVDPTPPRLLSQPPRRIENPTTVSDLRQELASEDRVEDLLQWIMEREPDLGLDPAMRLFHLLVSDSEEATASNDRSSYLRENLSVQAQRWRWDNPSNRSKRKTISARRDAK